MPKLRTWLLFTLFLIWVFYAADQPPFKEKQRNIPGTYSRCIAVKAKPIKAEKREEKTEKLEEKAGKGSPARKKEEITYRIMLGRLFLGYARYRHDRVTELNGTPVDVIEFETKLAKFSDKEVIYCDQGTSLPLLVEREISQLIKPERIRELYDQKNFRLEIAKKHWREEKITIQKDGPIHNAIILPFFVRQQPGLNIGWFLDINLPQKKYRLKIDAIEEVEVPAGKFPAYYFTSDPEQIKIWISNDEKRVPLKIEGTGTFGYKLLMSKYTPL